MMDAAQVVCCALQKPSFGTQEKVLARAPNMPGIRATPDIDLYWDGWMTPTLDP